MFHGSQVVRRLRFAHRTTDSQSLISRRALVTGKPTSILPSDRKATSGKGTCVKVGRLGVLRGVRATGMGKASISPGLREALKVAGSSTRGHGTATGEEGIIRLKEIIRLKVVVVVVHMDMVARGQANNGPTQIMKGSHTDKSSSSMAVVIMASRVTALVAARGMAVHNMKGMTRATSTVVGASSGSSLMGTGKASTQAMRGSGRDRVRTAIPGVGARTVAATIRHRGGTNFVFVGSGSWWRPT